jgi:phospholipid-binding lipoprotein MlaA
VDHSGPNLSRCVLAFALCAALPLAACASTPSQRGADYPETYDPLEPVNRAVFRFNDRVDRWVLRPVAETYERLPTPVRTGVGNFWLNLTYPYVAANSFLQGKGQQGLADSGRFLVNTTIGVLGIFDPATKMGLERNEEDFGQTFAVWGAGDGPYLVLPLLGASNARDAAGLGVSFLVRGALYPPIWADVDSATHAGLFAAGTVDTRARLLPATRLMEEAAVDPYVFTREAYRQRRQHLIHDGAPPLDNFFDDEDDYEDD